MPMAHHKSAKKRIRRNERRRVINHARISRIRTFVKKVELAIDSGDKEVAQVAFKAAQPEMQRGVTNGVMNYAKGKVDLFAGTLSFKVFPIE